MASNMLPNYFKLNIGTNFSDYRGSVFCGVSGGQTIICNLDVTSDFQTPVGGKCATITNSTSLQTTDVQSLMRKVFSIITSGSDENVLGHYHSSRMSLTVEERRPENTNYCFLSDYTRVYPTDLKLTENVFICQDDENEETKGTVLCTVEFLEPVLAALNMFLGEVMPNCDFFFMCYLFGGDIQNLSPENMTYEELNGLEKVFEFLQMKLFEAAWNPQNFQALPSTSQEPLSQTEFQMMPAPQTDFQTPQMVFQSLSSTSQAPSSQSVQAQFLSEFQTVSDFEFEDQTPRDEFPRDLQSLLASDDIFESEERDEQELSKAEKRKKKKREKGRINRKQKTLKKMLKNIGENKNLMCDVTQLSQQEEIILESKNSAVREKTGFEDDREILDKCLDMAEEMQVEYKIKGYDLEVKAPKKGHDLSHPNEKVSVRVPVITRHPGHPLNIHYDHMNLHMDCDRLSKDVSCTTAQEQIQHDIQNGIYEEIYNRDSFYQDEKGLTHGTVKIGRVPLGFPDIETVPYQQLTFSRDSQSPKYSEESGMIVCTSFFSDPNEIVQMGPNKWKEVKRQRFHKETFSKVLEMCGNMEERPVEHPYKVRPTEHTPAMYPQYGAARARTGFLTKESRKIYTSMLFTQFESGPVYLGSPFSNQQDYGLRGKPNTKTDLECPIMFVCAQWHAEALSQIIKTWWDISSWNAKTDTLKVTLYAPKGVNPRAKNNLRLDQEDYHQHCKHTHKWCWDRGCKEAKDRLCGIEYSLENTSDGTH